MLVNDGYRTVSANQIALPTIQHCVQGLEYECCHGKFACSSQLVITVYVQQDRAQGHQRKVTILRVHSLS